MDINLWSIRNDFIGKLTQYISLHKNSDSTASFESIITLIDLIPLELLQLEACQHAPRVNVYTGFTDVMHCIDWVYQVNVTMKSKGHFPDALLKPTIRREQLTMDDFLIDAHGQAHLPASVITTLRRTIMDCSTTYQSIVQSNEDLADYYGHKLKAPLREVQHVIECFSNLALEVNHGR